MKVQVTTTPLSETRSDAWLVFCVGGKPVTANTSDRVEKRLRRMIDGWIKTTGYKGRVGEVGALPCWESLPVRFILLAGVGKKEDFNAARFRKAAAAAARSACRLKIGTVATSLAGAKVFPSGANDLFVRSVADAFSYGFYSFSDFKSSKRARPAGHLILTGMDKKDRSLQNSAREALVEAETIAVVRDIANLPANEAPPRVIAARAKALASKHGLSCTVMGPGELRRARCNALLAVGRGSAESPRLITLKYRGRDPRLKPVVLVGKTITFDTGGISLKPAKGMEWMKYDKCGGMAVLAATLAAARLRLRSPVIGILVAAENMPGGGATRPGDIVRARNGKTIEILNTDAEGRLVLADALSMAADHKPAAIVDLATLTGAVIVALGHVLAAVLGNRDGIVEDLRAAGEATGERLWPLPLLPEYKDDIRGTFADLLNI